ncbi:MAG: DUF4167 domain-containing protein [Sphingomonadales bacterium]|nr:MAG: DUF4167 domain-containing protein [Sphingomonadales bacterium]
MSLNNNNRNNRRRGRGNRNQGGNGAQLNRIDSRARGNAPQMLDKYKKLAQDAQHNGDRVQMEYYLQFADHYFRVIADNKARQDEQRGGRRGNDDREQAEEFEDDFDFDRGRRSEAPTRSPYEQSDNDSRGDVMEGEPGQEGETFLTEDRGNDRGEDRDDNRQRGPRRQPQQRKPRDGERDGGRSEKRTERPERAAERPAERAEKPARGRKPRKPADESEQRGIDSSILPPSIRGDDTGGDSGTLETVD